MVGSLIFPLARHEYTSPELYDQIWGMRHRTLAATEDTLPYHKYFYKQLDNIVPE
ncbi:MAG: hypothetical protein JO235_10840 [Chroococcidiopsidaceae cyanobacterium CP_BM_RX_35]|nr:hypothetical protein [Chroococcidiopsidaceae cyanobacterium CP_BM_RX_35]